MAPTEGESRPPPLAGDDSPVWLAIGIVLALAGLLLARSLGAGLSPDLAWVFFLAAAVGFAELVSRYRDAPWRVARSLPGFGYIALNGLAGVAAHQLLGWLSPDARMDAATRVLVAGLGAMVLLRTRLMSIRLSNGTDVEVGPSFLVTTLLSAVNREVDRLRAQDRLRLVNDWARRCAAAMPFAQAEAQLRASLLAFQNLDAEERRGLNDLVRRLMEDDAVRVLPDLLKYQMVGYDFLTAFGDDAFRAVFQEVLRMPAPRG